MQKDIMDNAISKWLQKYEPINEIAQTIHIEKNLEEAKSLALARSGVENLPLKYIGDTGWHRQYHYMLYLKSESETDKQRLLNYDWLDDLSNWIAEKNKTRDFPELGENKVVTEVSCSNTLTYAESEDGSISEYMIQLSFNVRKEK